MLFDDLTEIYEALIDWTKRLAHEEPFYRDLFARVGARAVLDVACGTGRHAAMFHSWGKRVEGADISDRMIQQARANFGEPDGLRWVVRRFDEPASSDGAFDAAVCVGNSLALAADVATVHQAIRKMVAAVRPGGVVIAHALNLWHLPDGPCVWQKCKRATLPEAEVLIAKGVHRSGAQGYVDLLAVPLEDPSGKFTASIPFLGLETTDLEAMASDGGAHAVRFFGGYQGQPYDRQASTDLVMVAEK